METKFSNLKVKSKISLCGTVLFLSFSAGSLFAQSRIVISDNTVVNIHGGTSSAPSYVVVDNSNANALLASGDGHILSEGQFNTLRWNIANATGMYNVPFGDDAATALPISLNITGAGTNDGAIDFAMFGTGQNNLPLPQGVSSIAHQDIIGDGLPAPAADGAKLYDRYWFIDAASYTTKPSGTMMFTYNPASQTGDLTAGLTSMSAQFHNGTAWVVNQFGVDDLSGTISGVPFSNSSFFSTFTLVESGAALPITLLTFNAIWADERQSAALVKWSTASEQNNDFFVVERSADGQNWQALGQVEGAGNSIHINNYQFTDEQPLSGVSYYRLRQVDFDGTINFTHVVSLKKEINGASISVYPNPAGNQFQIAFEGFESPSANINILDNAGRTILTLSNDVINNPVQIIQTTNFHSGVYYIHVTSETESFVEKIVITD
jgi:hypothetical protein